MSTHVADDATAEVADADSPQYSPRMDLVYLKVAGVLVVLTAMEIYASYADFLDKLFLPVMLSIMVVKFLLVVLFFMHLRWDSKLFGRLFWGGALLAARSGASSGGWPSCGWPRIGRCTTCRRSTSTRPTCSST